MGDKRSRNIMYELLAVNAIIILLDIALLSVEYKNLFQIEVTLKGLIYSIKLKLELGVLSRLVSIVSGGDSSLQRTATIEEDFKNLADSENKAFGGLDFCTSPLPDQKIESTTSSDSTLSTASHDHARNPSPMKARTPSVPWLTTSLRAKPVSPSNPSVFRPSLPSQPSSRQTTIKNEAYANSEFLTSAAVTEGANDDNIRQFQKEIEAELGGKVVSDGLKVPRLHRSLPSWGSLPEEKEESRGRTRRMTEPVTKGVEVQDEVEEEDWARGLGVLGPEKGSRESSLGRLYPGRITGEGL